MSSEQIIKKSQFDVLVVGAGPAGLAAAACAAECGSMVGIVDDNLSPGGQIWRGESANTSSEAAGWVDRLHAAGVQVFCGTRVFHQSEPGMLLAEEADDLFELSYRKLIVE